MPRRGIDSSPGRKPPAYSRINTLTDTAGVGTGGRRWSAYLWLSYSLPGSFLQSTGGSLFPRAEVLTEQMTL
jgi:hypothetical protein